MKINKSLSARIKRRNKQGFLGEGNHTDFDRWRDFGDYRIDNYKYLDKNLEQQHLIAYAKKHGYSNHAGSKTLGQLKRYL